MSASVDATVLQCQLPAAVTDHAPGDPVFHDAKFLRSVEDELGIGQSRHACIEPAIGMNQTEGGSIFAVAIDHGEELVVLAVIAFELRERTRRLPRVGTASPQRKIELWARVSVMQLGIAVCIYAIGWGATLALGFVFGAAEIIRVVGSRAARRA